MLSVPSHYVLGYLYILHLPCPFLIVVFLTVLCAAFLYLFVSARGCLFSRQCSFMRAAPWNRQRRHPGKAVPLAFDR